MSANDKLRAKLGLDKVTDKDVEDAMVVHSETTGENDG